MPFTKMRHSCMSVQLLVLQALLVFLLTVIATVRANKHQEWLVYCDIGSEPIVEVYWNETASQYLLWDDDAKAKNSLSNQTERQRRLVDSNNEEIGSIKSFLGRLRGFTSSTTTIHNEPSASASILLSRKAQENGTATSMVDVTSGDTERMHDVIIRQLKRCPCWSYASQGALQDFYCPATRTHCGLPAGYLFESAVSENDLNDGPIFSTTQPVGNQIPKLGCLNVSQLKTFVENVWPVVFIWYLAMFLCLLFTRTGRHAIGYIISLCWKEWDSYKTHQIISEDPQYANQLLLRHVAENAAAANAAAAAAATSSSSSTTGNTGNISNNDSSDADDSSSEASAGFEITIESFPLDRSSDEDKMSNRECLLRIKTHYYNHDRKERGKSCDKCLESENDVQCDDCQEGVEVTLDNDNDSIFLLTCAICHTEIEDGDRVGDIVCGHTMHIECLKRWIPRRNVCPLCRAEDIAMPRPFSSFLSRDIVISEAAGMEVEYHEFALSSIGDD